MKLNSVTRLWVLVFILTGYSTNSFSDEVEELYWSLVDRGKAEEHILEKNNISKISADKLNKIYGASSRFEDSILRIATYRGFGAIVRQILDGGASPNIELKNNCSPLGVAISETRSDLVIKLIEYGADTRLPMCWNYITDRFISVDIAINNYQLSDEARMSVMRRHAALGEDLSSKILYSSIVNNNLKVAKLYLELMPEYRDPEMLKLAKSHSSEIFITLKENWSQN